MLDDDFVDVGSAGLTNVVVVVESNGGSVVVTGVEANKDLCDNIPLSRGGTNEETTTDNMNEYISTETRVNNLERIRAGGKQNRRRRAAI